MTSELRHRHPRPDRFEHPRHAGRVADADRVAQRHLVAAQITQSPSHIRHHLRRDGALVGTAHHAGDVAPHAHTRRLRRGQDRLEAGDRFGDRAVDVLLREGLGRCREHRHLLGACGHRRLEALQVRRQHRVVHAGEFVLRRQAGHHLGVVGHLRHPLRRDEGRRFDVLQARRGQPADQRQLGGGGDELLLVLQAVARADFDDAHVPRWFQVQKIHGCTSTSKSTRSTPSVT